MIWRGRGVPATTDIQYKGFYFKQNIMLCTISRGMRHRWEVNIKMQLTGVRVWPR
jgi:hypothetical protein